MVKPRRIKGLDCDSGAAAGIRLALRERFEEMCALRTDALDWTDLEGVHSMRVASRRLRSAIRGFMPYVNRRGLGRVVKDIRSIADALGKVRDQDVAILALEKLSAQTPEKFSPTLQQLIDARNEIRKTARRELKKTITKTQLKQFGRQFDAALNTAITDAPTGALSNRSEPFSYKNLGTAVIRDRLRELEKLSASLRYPFDVKQLHEMRIAAKRLRYAIELFEECFDSKIMSFAKHAADLQSDLGKLHDCDVWIESFEKQIRQSKKSSDRSVGETFVWLFTHFQDSRNKHYRNAFLRWNEWQAEKLAEQLRDLIAPQVAPQVAQQTAHGPATHASEEIATE